MNENIAIGWLGEAPAGDRNVCIGYQAGLYCAATGETYGPKTIRYNSTEWLCESCGSACERERTSCGRCGAPRKFLINA